MSDLIDRQAAIDTLDKHLQTTDVPVSYPGIISALTEWLNEVPSAQQDSKETSPTHKALDTISRQAAMEEISKQQTYKMFEGEDTLYLDANDVGSVIASLPSAQPERLTDDDFETIRIHLNAFKKILCNQQRWEEANEYQRIIDRFMAFASAQPFDEDINVPNNNCISRQDAIDAFYKYPNIYWTTLDVLAKIDALQSAQSERQKGEWIDYTEDGYVEYPICHSATNCDGNKDERTD